MTADCLSNAGRPIIVMHVEDNSGDILLLRRAMQGLKSAYDIIAVKTAEAALTLLHNKNREDIRIIPDFIILDLNLPQMNGLDLLTILKNDPELKHIPAIVLSSSRANQDVMQSYQLHATGYILKPSSPDMLKQVTKAIETFFVDLILTPRKRPIH